jgi:segregation and condensation protein A
MKLNVKLQVFEGPLDLLLHLLEKNKVNIYDIPIVEITKQYMEYIEEMQRQDLDVMSEFLVMAATLVDIKARMLLPPEVNEEGEEIDPRSELVEQLLQYKMYKYMSLELKDRQIDAGRCFYREASIPEEVLKYEEPVDLEELCKDVSLTQLQQIFHQTIKRQEDKIDPIRSSFGTIKKEEVSLSDKIEELTAYAATHPSFSFRELLEQQQTKMETIVMFLAVLEMIKTGGICVRQESLFDDIQIEVRQRSA